MSQNKLKQLAAELNGRSIEEGLALTAEVIPGEVDVLQVSIQDREEFPVYVSMDESQILCVTHLWKENEIKEGKREELLDALLTMNVSMPLSAFSKVGNQYIIFGALATTSVADDITHEIEVLSENTLDAVEAISDYLV